MTIDEVSKNIILIALYLDSKVPGIVSEIWISETEVAALKSQISTDVSISAVINAAVRDVASLNDERRKSYLQAILDSLIYQIEALHNEWVSFSEFSRKAYGFEIKRVAEQEIRNIEAQIHDIEKRACLSRHEMFAKYSLSDLELQPTFENFVSKVKGKLPKYILEFPDQGFEFEVVSNKPWSAFNSHIAPFKSKLTLNKDVGFTKLDLYRLAFHEACGGHHSELSNKDKLLVTEQKGEHGLVITFSPQTFISEAIAEGIYVLLGGLDQTNEDYFLGWHYDRLIFALQNAATFWFFDDRLSKSEIQKKLKTYTISDKTAENILNFSTDPLFGKYAPVYYSAFNFIDELHKTTSKKEKLIRTLFTKPCTPNILMEEFKN